MVQLLLDRRANVRTWSKNGEMPFYGVLHNFTTASTDILRQLLERGVGINTHSSRGNGKSALHILAAREDGGDLMKVLLEHFGSFAIRMIFNEFKSLEITAVHYAVALGHTQVLEVLLRNPCINSIIRRWENPTPLSHTAEAYITSLIHTPLAYDQTSSSPNPGHPLLLAVKERRQDVASLILQLTGGSGINAMDEREPTPLQITMEAGDIDMFRMLIEQRDIDIHKRDRRGRTPLEVAEMMFDKPLFFHLLRIKEKQQIECRLSQGVTAYLATSI